MYQNFHDLVISFRKCKDPSSPLVNFDIIKKIGQGAFSEVWLIEEISTGKKYALKVVSKRQIERHNIHASVYVEKLILQQNLHFSIVKLYSLVQDKNYLYFITEYLSKGNLLKFLKKRHWRISLVQIKFIVKQLIGILEVLHLNGIIHRDLKPENILLDDQFSLKIIDFGCADVFHVPGNNDSLYANFLKIKSQFEKISFNCNSVTEKVIAASDRKGLERPYPAAIMMPSIENIVGTLCYLSPETVAGQISGRSGDIWALGIIVNLLFTGKQMFDQSEDFLVLDAITRQELELGSSIPEEGRSLIKSLLRRNITERLGCTETTLHQNLEALKRHSFIHTRQASIECTLSPLSIFDGNERDGVVSFENIGLSEMVSVARVKKWLLFSRKVFIRLEKGRIVEWDSQSRTILNEFNLDFRLVVHVVKDSCLELVRDKQHFQYFLADRRAEEWKVQIQKQMGTV